MDIQIIKFKTFFQLISTLIIVFIWVSFALSDVVLPTKSNAEDDDLSFIISTGRAALNTIIVTILNDLYIVNKN